MLRALTVTALTLAFLMSPAVAQAGKKEDQAIAAYKEGKAHGKEGDFAKAVASFQKAVDLVPFPKAYIYMGYSYERLDRWPEALAAYDSAVKEAKKERKKDNVAEAYNSLGTLYRKMGLFELAVGAHKSAAKAAKKDKKDLATAQYELALDYVELEKLTEAVAALKATLKARPGDLDAELLMGNIYVEQEKFVEAEEVFQAILKKDAKSGDAMFGMGVMLRKRGDKKAAKEWFTKGCDAGHSKCCRAKKTRYRSIQ